MSRCATVARKPSISVGIDDEVELKRLFGFLRMFGRMFGGFVKAFSDSGPTGPCRLQTATALLLWVSVCIQFPSP